MKKTNVQEIATLLRNIAYSKPGIDWSMRIVHPKTNTGDVGYSAGIWHKNREMERISVSFSYDNTSQITNFKLWKDKNEIQFSFGQKPSIEDVKNVLMEKFEIKNLYEDKIPVKEKTETYAVYIDSYYVRDAQCFIPEYPLEDGDDIGEKMSDDNNWNDSNKYGLFVGLYNWLPSDEAGLKAYVAKKHALMADTLVCVAAKGGR